MKFKKFNSKLSWSLLAILIIFLLALSLLVWKFNLLGIAEKLTPKGQFYQGEAFSFRYPQDFKKMSLENLQKIDPELKAGLEDSKGEGRFLLKIKQGTIKAESLEEIEKDLTSQMEKKFTSFEKIKWQEAKISGQKALDYYYSYQSKGEKVKQRMILVFSKDKIYYLTFHAPWEKFEAYREDFDLIISTFKI